MIRPEDITIVMPVYNRTEYFREALESALNQTVPVSILVVNDGCPASSSKFRDIIGPDNDRVKYVECEKNLGQSGHWNRCLGIAGTRWVSMLHDDDVLLPNAIEHLMKAVETIPGKALYFGIDDGIDETGKVRVHRQNEVNHQILEFPTEVYVVHNQFCAAGALIDRELTLSLGGFNPHLKMTLDWDMWVRLCLHSGAVRINEIVARYRSYFDLNRGTTVQEIDAKKIVRVSVQLKRNIARFKAKYPDVALPDWTGRLLDEMAISTLRVLGCRCTWKGRLIYFAYARGSRRFQKNQPDFFSRLKADINSFASLAYSYVRPIREYWRQKRT
jgi:glycosyltransferase involved in cell wall biosynthesis